MSTKAAERRLPWIGQIKYSADWAAAGLVAGVAIALFVPVTYVLIKAGATDFMHHNEWARELAETGHLATAHFLYQALSVVAHAVIPGIGYTTSGFIVDLAAYVACGVLIYALLRLATAAWPVNQGLWVSGLATVGLMLAAPIPLLALADHHLYFGYISPNVYHNPTITLLKPLALAHFALVVAALTRRVPSHAGTLALLAVLGVLATLAKPSYSLAVLPAVGLVGLWHWRSALKQWPLYVLGIGLPMAAVMAFQYLGTFGSGDSIILAPLLAMGYRSGWLLPKLVLSCLFPLVVYAAYFPAARRSLGLNLAWLSFAAGVAFTYLLAETGERTYQLNFAWSAQVTLLILFCYSTGFFFRQAQAGLAAHPWPRLTWRAWVCAAVFGLHVAAGLVWYSVHLSGRPVPWW